MCVGQVGGVHCCMLISLPVDIGVKILDNQAKISIFIFAPCMIARPIGETGAL